MFAVVSLDEDDSIAGCPQSGLRANNAAGHQCDRPQQLTKWQKLPSLQRKTGPSSRHVLLKTGQWYMNSLLSPGRPCLFFLIYKIKIIV